jgi:hypothetical protein
MKFVYVDETGGEDQSDVFVMTGLLIDAFNLRICTVTFDDMITEFLKTHPKVKTELKTQAIINGSKAGAKTIMWNERNLSTNFALSRLDTQSFIPSLSRFKHSTTL